MKSIILNFKKTKYSSLLIFLFLSMKYYLFSDLIEAEFPWFGINRLFDNRGMIFAFLLSVAHLVLCTAIVLKFQKLYPDNRLILILLITDPFYLTSFCSLKSLLFAVLFELSIVFFNDKKPIISNIFFIAACLIAPIVLFGVAYAVLPFVILVFFILTEKTISHRQALLTFFLGVLSVLAGAVLAYAIKENLLFANQPPFVDCGFGLADQINQSKFKTAFLIVLFVAEAAFWVNQIITYIGIKKSEKLKKERAEKALKKKARKSPDRKSVKAPKEKGTNLILLFVLGLAASVVPVVLLFFNIVYFAPTLTLSFIVCLIAFNEKAPDKVNNLINVNTLPAVIAAVVVNSFITKEYLPISEALRIISDFAPM